MTTDWSVLLYTVANDDGDDDRVTRAIAEMQAALDAAPANRCQVAVQVHAKHRTTRHWLAQGRKIRDEVLPTKNAGAPQTLQQFLDDAHAAIQPRYSALVMWAHSNGIGNVMPPAPRRKPSGTGVHEIAALERAASSGGAGLVDRAELDAGIAILGGAIGGASAPPPGHVMMSNPPRVTPGTPRTPSQPPQSKHYGWRWGPDPNTNDYLTSIEMRKAIAASARTRVDVVGLNACGMASLEVAYELRGVAPLQVAAQSDAKPWQYGEIVDALASDPDQTPEQLASAIVRAVEKRFDGAEQGDVASALRSEAIEPMVAALEAYARRITYLMESDWPRVFQAIVKDAQRLDDSYLVDLQSLLGVLGKPDLKAKIAAAAVEAKLREVIVANAPHRSHPRAHGLSILCPKISRVDIPLAYRGTALQAHGWVKMLEQLQRRFAASLQGG